MKQISPTNYQYHKTEAVEFSDMAFVDQPEVLEAGGKEHFEAAFKQMKRNEFETIFGHSYMGFNMEFKWEAFGDGFIMHYSGNCVIHVSGYKNIEHDGLSRS